jgi:hypothetical protein
MSYDAPCPDPHQPTRRPCFRHRPTAPPAIPNRVLRPHARELGGVAHPDGRAIDWLYKTWLPQSGFVPDDRTRLHALRDGLPAPGQPGLSCGR